MPRHMNEENYLGGCSKMKVLIVNCGSSSLKYQVIDSESEQVLAKGLCERIGIDGRLIYQPAGGEKEVTEAPMPSHTEAIQMVLDALVNEKTGILKSLAEVDAIGHRVLHGGAKITESCVINDEVLKVIEECCDLGPLHNPANLKGIYACQKLMPGKPNVAVFDTAFHQSMPTKAFMYGIPYEYYEKYHIRKYGFHGTSHSFVSKETIKFLNLDPNNSRVIVCHLGNGSSISAVKDSKCVDTSMGLTPLEGLVMGTRSGDIDPAVVEYICNKEGKTVSEVLNMLNKKSGVYGLTKGLSSDFRDLEAAMSDGNQLAADAIEIFCYRVAKTVGSYVAAMNGVDAIAFTAGIGENAPLIREKVCEYLGYLGIKIDASKNNCRGKEVVISTDDSAKLVAVVPTNEEIAIMRETVALV